MRQGKWIHVACVIPYVYIYKERVVVYMMTSKIQGKVSNREKENRMEHNMPCVQGKVKLHGTWIKSSCSLNAVRVVYKIVYFYFYFPFFFFDNEFFKRKFGYVITYASLRHLMLYAWVPKARFGRNCSTECFLFLLLLLNITPSPPTRVHYCAAAAAPLDTSTVCLHFSFRFSPNPKCQGGVGRICAALYNARQKERRSRRRLLLLFKCSTLLRE